MDTKKIGQFLRDLRQEQNLTQEELGEQLGVTNKTISRWETGTYMPPVDILLQMSKLYNISINEILSGERLAIADYQPKAEENIVSSLNSNVKVKKNSKKIAMICGAIILALLIVSIVLISTLVLKDKYITVTFDSRGGSDVKSYNLLKNDNVVEYPIVEPNAPTKTGFSFMGWFYAKGNGEARWDFNVNTVKASMTLYAKWEQATKGLQYTINNGEDGYVLTGRGFNWDEKELVIPSYYNGKPVVHIMANAFKNTNITSVSIPDTVISIGNGAFEKCEQLVDVKLSDNLRVVGGNVFSECTSLKSIYLPQKLEAIEKNMFWNCTSLQSIDLSNGIIRIESGAFYNCYSLVKLTIGADVLYVSDDAFSGCDSLVEVCNMSSKVNLAKYPQFNSVLYSYYGSIDEKSRLQTYQDYWVYDYYDNPLIVRYVGDKTDVTLPNDVNGKAYSIHDYAFSQSNVVSVTMPSNVHSIGKFAFSKCYQLSSVTAQNGLKRIADGAFKGNSNLVKIEIPNSVEELGKEIFFGCGNVSSATLPICVLSQFEQQFTRQLGGLEITIADGTETINATAISEGDLYKLTIPKSVKYIDSKVFANRWVMHLTVDGDNPYFYCKDGCLVSMQDKTLIYAMKGFELPTDGSVRRIATFAFPHTSFKSDLFIPACIDEIEEGAFRYGYIINITVDTNNPNYYSRNNCLISREGKVIFLSLTGKISDDGVVIGIGNNVLNGTLISTAGVMPPITIPKCITSISYYAFDASWTRELIYEGTIEEFKQIELDVEFNWMAQITKVVCADGEILPPDTVA